MMASLLLDLCDDRCDGRSFGVNKIEGHAHTFVSGSNPRWTWKSIKDLPGIEIEKAVAEGWKRYANAGGMHNWDRGEFAYVAVGYGHVDALGVLIDALFVDQDGPGRIYGAIEQVYRHIDFSGTREQIRDWYRENRDKLVFDEERRIYRVGD